MSLIPLFFYVFDLAFDFWPIILLNSINRRNTALRNMLWSWSGWAIIRIFLFFSPDPLPPILPLIPEPWNTILFFITGIFLFSFSFGRKYWKQSRLKSKALGIRSVKELLEVSPMEFEDMAVALYQSAGHRAIRTGKNGDHGVDVVVKAKNGEHWIVQCKRWRKPVGEAIVREFYGTLLHEKAHQGAILAASGFSKPAIEWAKGKPIVLYSGEDFLKSWHRIKKQQAKKQTRRK